MLIVISGYVSVFHILQHGALALCRALRQRLDFTRLRFVGEVAAPSWRTEKVYGICMWVYVHISVKLTLSIVRSEDGESMLLETFVFTYHSTWSHNVRIIESRELFMPPYTSLFRKNNCREECNTFYVQCTFSMSYCSRDNLIKGIVTLLRYNSTTLTLIHFILEILSVLV